MATPPKAPARLTAKSRALWTKLTKEFEFRADELRVLEDCCREIDLIERMETELRDAPMVVRGSMGQPVAAPLVQEVRQHRATLARLFASLKLPDDSSSQEQRSSQARNAAQARWGTGQRRGA